MFSARVSRFRRVVNEEVAEAFHRVLARVLSGASILSLVLYPVVPRFEVLCLAMVTGVLAMCWWGMCSLLRVRRVVMEIERALVR